MNTRLTCCFTGANPHVDLAGLPKINYPCETLSINLLHVNIPFEYAVVPSPGFVLVCLEGESTNLFTAVDGGRHPYTWIIPFEPGSLTGDFSWFTQAAHAGDDRYTVQTRFIPSINLTFSFVAHAGAAGMPPTPADGVCSVEIGIVPKIHRS